MSGLGQIQLDERDFATRAGAFDGQRAAFGFDEPCALGVLGRCRRAWTSRRCGCRRQRTGGIDHLVGFEDASFHRCVPSGRKASQARPPFR